MRKTKATARALREACSMTQFDLATEFDVQTRTVKRWENPAHPSKYPADVLAWLEAACACMRERAVGLAESIAADKPEYVVLPYFRTQDELDVVQLPAGQAQPVGYFNATMRLVYDKLIALGIDACFGYGGEATVTVERWSKPFQCSTRIEEEG